MSHDSGAMEIHPQDGQRNPMSNAWIKRRARGSKHVELRVVDCS